MSLTAQESTPAVSAGPRELRDVPYVANGHERQKLDLYLPARPANGMPPPLVVWIHGGGWEGGSWHGGPARELAARGYAAASIGYRLSSQEKYPAQIEDCKAAVRWLRAHAREYGFDARRVGVWGASAGGHLVALLGTTADEHRFDVGENLDQSSAVTCVVDFFGPADFLHWGDPPLPSSMDTPNTALAHLLGGTVLTHVNLAADASPVYFVSKDAAPFLIVHGNGDPVVPVQQSIVLDAALRKAGVESTLVVLPGAGHGGPAFGEARITRQIAEFFERYLRARP